ncbi:uncharacterized protein LOC131879325 [Tigriopus californicus]|nr:uncharacterized protein LOC131879325 [Tigriopus californicus]
MLLKIHDLLQMEKPAKRKTIQVCFKHPDLLKQAREACVARREDGRPPHPSPHDAERSDPLPLRPRLPRETDVFAHTEVSGVSPAATTHVLCHPLPYPTAPPPVPVERKGLIPLPPLEVLNPTEPTTPPKVMCIQFDDNDIVDDSTGFQAEPAAIMDPSEDKAPMNQPSQGPSEISGMFEPPHRSESVLEPVTEAFLRNVPIMHEEEPPALADPSTQNSGPSHVPDKTDQTNPQSSLAVESRTPPDILVEPENNDQEYEESIMDDESLLESDENDGLTETDDEDLDSTSDEYESSMEEDIVDDLFQNIDKDRFKDPNKRFKICYQGYDQKVLSREMKDMVYRPHLHDLELICKDGAMTSSSLLIGSMSRFMYNVLQDAPWFDHLKMVIMPDVKRKDLSVLISLLFNPEKLANLPLRKVKRVERVAKQLQIDWNTLAAKENLVPAKPLHTEDAANNSKTGVFKGRNPKPRGPRKPKASQLGEKKLSKRQPKKAMKPQVVIPGKKKLGRPRKNPIPDEAVKTELGPIPNAQQESQNDPSSSNPPLPPKRPGRKRKVPFDSLGSNPSVELQPLKESATAKRRKSSKNMVQDPNPTQVTSQIPPAEIMETVCEEEPEPAQTHAKDEDDELVGQTSGPKTKRMAKKSTIQSQEEASPNLLDIKSTDKATKTHNRPEEPARSSATSTPTPSLGRASTPNRRKNEAPKKIERWDVKELQDFLANPIDEEISNVELIQPSKSDRADKANPKRLSKNGTASEGERESSKAESETRMSSRRRPAKPRELNTTKPEEVEVKPRARSQGRNRGRTRVRSSGRTRKTGSEVLSSTFEDTDASHPSNVSVSSNPKTGEDNHDNVEDEDTRRDLRNYRGLRA